MMALGEPIETAKDKDSITPPKVGDALAADEQYTAFSLSDLSSRIVGKPEKCIPGIALLMSESDSPSRGDSEASSIPGLPL
jgi:hypothetical protein